MRGFSASAVLEAREKEEANSPGRSLLLFAMLVIYPAFVALSIMLLGMQFLGRM